MAVVFDGGPAAGPASASGIALVLELIVAVEFLVFLALPVRAETPARKKEEPNAAAVGSR